LVFGSRRALLDNDNGKDVERLRLQMRNGEYLYRFEMRVEAGYARRGQPGDFIYGWQDIGTGSRHSGAMNGVWVQSVLK
jgi:hypothetical protein